MRLFNEIPDDMLAIVVEYLTIAEASVSKRTSKHFQAYITRSLAFPIVARPRAILPREFSFFDDVVQRLKACPKIETWCVDVGEEGQDDFRFRWTEMSILHDLNLMRSMKHLRSLILETTKSHRWFMERSTYASECYIPEEPARAFPHLERAALLTDDRTFAKFLHEWSHVKTIYVRVRVDNELDWPKAPAILTERARAAKNIKEICFEFSSEWGMENMEAISTRQWTRTVLENLARAVATDLTALRIEFDCGLQHELENYNVPEIEGHLWQILEDVKGIVETRLPHVSAQKIDLPDTYGVNFTGERTSKYFKDL